MPPIKKSLLPFLNTSCSTSQTSKTIKYFFLLALAFFLAGCRAQSTSLPIPPAKLSTPIFTPIVKPTLALPSQTPSPVIVPIYTSNPIPPDPTLLPEPFPVPAYEILTLSQPDGSSLVVKNYTCPRAQAATQAPVYGYRVVNTYPHDPSAYTQGLIYRDSVLYESTGQYGTSYLRRVRLEDGQVLQQRDLPLEYFGEGMTEMSGKIYQLTWKENTGFVVDLQTFEPLGAFTYPTQGWGLTHDSQQLIMSDGTNRLFFIDPETLNFVGYMLVADEFGPILQINELEYVNGEVWANLYQSACVARIDLKTGQFSGWIDLTGLLAPEELVTAEVPNGIAYDPASGRIFVTGKFWPKMFEIELLDE